MNDHVKILGEAVKWRGGGRGVALATVVSTWGSSPRPVGSRLAVNDGGHFLGSVSGGCVEGEVLVAAEEAMETGRPILLEFGVSDDKAWSVGLACGGAIKVLVEPFADATFFASIVQGCGQGRSAACVVALDSGHRSLLDSESLRRLDLDEQTLRALRAVEAAGRDKLVETPAGRFFVEFWRPPLRLFIIGAVHIAQALAPIAATAGYDVTVIDPRGAFVTPERFAGVTIRAQWPEDYFAGNPLDESGALVALTHEPRLDDPALIAALRSPAFYIGALGSRGSAEKRRQRLRGLNIAESALARIHGPIGLPIGAATPAEIAIAIAAEMTAALRLDRAAEMGSAAE